VATHDIAMVRDNFARTIVMDDGRIAADGPTADIFGDRDLLEVHGLTS
jgi:energy-coupling factor transporter ATP-binding protein EcfA2